MLNKIIKWLFAPYRKNRLIDKITNRENICLYDKTTGKRYKTILILAPKEYNPCSGKKIKKFRPVTICICSKEYTYACEEGFWKTRITISRHGDFKILHDCYEIKEDKKLNKKYIVRTLR